MGLSPLEVQSIKNHQKIKFHFWHCFVHASSFPSLSASLSFSLSHRARTEVKLWMVRFPTATNKSCTACPQVCLFFVYKFTTLQNRLNFIWSKSHICQAHYILKHDAHISTPAYFILSHLKSCRYSALNSCKQNQHNLARSFISESVKMKCPLKSFICVCTNLSRATWKNYVEFPWIINHDRSPGGKDDWTDGKNCFQ